MLVAHDSTGTRVEASRRMVPAKYFCPSCGSPVIAKPGRVKVAHFAHVVRSDCPSAGESVEHLYAKKVLAEGFRAVGYEVALEEPHPRERRVDVAVTLPHPLRPLRYAVEVQNSAIDPREMFRRLLADLESGFWYTAWVFTGARAARLLAADVGADVRVPADVLSEEHILTFPEGVKSRRQLTDLIGMEAGGWLGDRLASGSYGCIGGLYGVKCLDADGLLWLVQLDKVARRERATGGRGTPLQSTRRISRKRPMSFDMFGPVWGPGDEQRLALAAALAESFIDDLAPIDLDIIHQLAARVLKTPRTAALDEWVRRTLESIFGYPLRPGLTEGGVRRMGRIFVESHEQPTRVPPCGWPAAPGSCRTTCG
ncbi:competence protein CoiA [Actinokineospora sp. NPDC004072]